MIKDFWYPFLFYVLGTSYLLLAVNFFRKRIFLVNGLIFILLVWQIGYAFELYFRYVYDQTDNLNSLLTSQRWEKRHIEDLNQLIGAEQFRDSRDWREAKQPGLLRIAVVGDSIAYGIGIERAEDRFSNLLEAKLNASGLPANVYTLARPGDDLPQTRINFDKILKQGDFDLIIWQLFPNDLPASPSADVVRVKTLLQGENTNPLLKDLLNRSYAFNFFYFRLWGLFDDFRAEHLNYQTQAFERDEIWQPAKKQMMGMIDDIRAHRVDLIAVLFPYPDLIGSNYPKLPHQKLAEVFNEKQTIFVDLLDTYQAYRPNELMANRYDGHPDELGHQLAAEAIFVKVSQLY